MPDPVAVAGMLAACGEQTERLLKTLAERAARIEELRQKVARLEADNAELWERLRVAEELVRIHDGSDRYLRMAEGRPAV